MQDQSGDGPPLWSNLQNHPYLDSQANGIQIYSIQLDNINTYHQSFLQDQIDQMIQNEDSYNKSQKDKILHRYVLFNLKKSPQKLNIIINEDKAKDISNQIDIQQKISIQKEEKDKRSNSNIFYRISMLQKLIQKLPPDKIKDIQKQIDLKSKMRNQKAFFLCLINFRLKFSEQWHVLEAIVLTGLKQQLQKARGKPYWQQMCYQQRKIKEYVNHITNEQYEEAFDICYQSRRNNRTKQHNIQLRCFLLTKNRQEKRKQQNQMAPQKLKKSEQTTIEKLKQTPQKDLKNNQKQKPQQKSKKILKHK